MDHPANPDVLVVAAHLPELAGLRRWLGEQLCAEVAGLRVCAEAVGIGLPAAAGGAAALLEHMRPRVVMLIGTCGAYQSSGIEIGDAVVGSSVHLASVAVALGSGAFPEPMPAVIDADPAIVAGLCATGLRAVAVATTLAITVDDELGTRMASRHRCQVEHLEAFGVAQRAGASDVAFASVLGVANHCGAGAREQWRANHRRAGDQASRQLIAWLERAAPGLRAARPRGPATA